MSRFYIVDRRTRAWLVMEGKKVSFYYDVETPISQSEEERLRQQVIRDCIPEIEKLLKIMKNEDILNVLEKECHTRDRVCTRDMIKYE